MNEYKGLPRLKSEDKTGQKHIFVKGGVYPSYRQHWHDYFEMELITGGSGTYFYNGVPHEIKKGAAYLLTPIDFHRAETTDSIELVNVSFDTRWLADDVRALLYSDGCTKIRQFDDDEVRRLVSVIELLKNEYESDGPCIKQLLEYLVSRFLPARAGQEANRTQMSGVMKAVAYMEQHFREKITLEDLSAMSGYHPAYFSNLFCRVVGETFTRRLITLRINYAKTLLRSGIPVAEVCFASGFGSLSNFSSVFKKRCGMSPGEYRDKERD